MSVFGGIIHLPQHHLADMHGLLRGIVRLNSRLKVRSVLSHYRIEIPPSAWLMGLWCESKSLIEASATEGFDGQVFVCSLPMMYLKTEYYERLNNPVSRDVKPIGLLGSGVRPSQTTERERVKTRRS